ncbi:MAG: SpoIIE family protein phosphatase [Planctomycetota bacterium]
MAGRKKQAKGGRRSRSGGERSGGYGVAYRFAILVSLTIAALMTVFGVVNTFNAIATLNAEIDQSGILIAQALAVPDVSTWSSLAGTSGEDDPSSADEGFRPKDEVERARFRANVRRLVGFVAGSGNVVDAYILNAEQNRVLRGAREGESQGVEFVPEKTRQDGETSIRYGTFPEANRREDGRQFVHPIHQDPSDPESPIVGYSAVVLSERRIGDRVFTLLWTTVAFTLAFIALGAFVARYAAGRITQPLRELTRDVETIAAGNLDHRTSVRTHDEIGTLARAFDEMTRGLQEGQKIEIENRARKQEARIVNEITAHLLPSDLPQPKGIEIDGLYQPSKEVGGDYYDAFGLGESHLGLVVAHAPVSGVPGAIIMTMARSILGVEARRTLSPADTLRQTNRYLAPDLRKGLYVDCLYAVLDVETRELVVASAGQCVILRRSGRTGSIEKIHTDGFALGFDRGPVFDRRLNEVRLPLEPGDRICLCTDGLLAVTGEDGEEFGERRLGLLMKKEAELSATRFIARLRESLDAFTGGHPALDLTVLNLRVGS